MTDLPLGRRFLCGFAAMLLFLGPCAASAWAGVEPYAGRNMIVHVPARLPPSGSRALVIVLHGGLGNADRIAGGQAESELNLDAVADKDGFIVAYLNGTPVTRRLGAKFLGWNAGGGCCGVPAETGVDDVAYIRGAVDHLATEYGVDRARVFGVGHSNGAMMVQRMVCETDVFAAGVAFSGPLNIEASDCIGARGKRILAVHGADDANVPVAGGTGKGLSRVSYASEAQAQQALTRAGAVYTLQIVPGADHALAHIGTAVQKAEGMTLAEKTARFFGLAQP
jgi:polyhydroxybutyrate depolymerase